MGIATGRQLAAADQATQAAARACAHDVQRAGDEHEVVGAAPRRARASQARATSSVDDHVVAADARAPRAATLVGRDGPRRVAACSRSRASRSSARRAPRASPSGRGPASMPTTRMRLADRVEAPRQHDWRSASAPARVVGAVEDDERLVPERPRTARACAPSANASATTSSGRAARRRTPRPRRGRRRRCRPGARRGAGGTARGRRRRACAGRAAGRRAPSWFSMHVEVDVALATTRSAPAARKMAASSGSVSPSTSVRPGLTMPAFSAATSSQVGPAYSVWSCPTLVTTATWPSTTLVASHRPSRPTSTTATSTATSANQRNAAAVRISK